MIVVCWLLFSFALAPQVSGPPKPVDPEMRAQFRVNVTAPDTITSRVYEYLQLVAYRNNLRARFGDRGPAVELELVLMFESYPKLPWNRRDIGSLNLILSPDTDRARVEYCLRRCTDLDADIVVYTSTLDAFMKKLDAASAALARRYR
jgi:hypothetical protein